MNSNLPGFFWSQTVNGRRLVGFLGTFWRPWCSFLSEFQVVQNHVKESFFSHLPDARSFTATEEVKNRESRIILRYQKSQTGQESLESRALKQLVWVGYFVGKNVEENEPNQPANVVCCRIAGCLRLTMKREPLLISMDEPSVRKGTDSLIFQIFQPSKFNLQEDTPFFCCTKVYLVGGFIFHFFIFPSYWECHHPNWFSYFSDG